MATRAATAMQALILLGAVLLLLPYAAVADHEAATADALFAHILEVSKSGLGEMEKPNGRAPPSPPGSVAAETGFESVDAENVMIGDDASDLMAHILAVQRKTLEANAGGEEVAVEEALGDDAEEETKEVAEEEEEEDGGVDPQERVKELEAILKSLTDDPVGYQEELGAHKVQLKTNGAKSDDVINLLHKYAREMHVKLNPNGASQESEQPAGEQSQADGGVDLELNKVHDDHVHLHEHDHGHEHEHEHEHEHGHVHKHEHHGHDYGHEDAHANVVFSRASDAPLHIHDHSHDHNHDNCHGHNHDHDHAHGHGHVHRESIQTKKFVLPEEIAEEEDLLQYGFEGQVYSSAEQPKRLRGPDTGVWLRAMGCSLLVSLASLICLMILPCIVSNGKPSERVVNALAAFGAGAMLGDAFLHQLPHAFGNSGPAHSHDAHQHDHDHGHSHSHSHGHDHTSAAGQGHAHSLQDLSIGLAVLGGILLFFIVEKIVRRYEELSSYSGQRTLGHSHHHHQKKKVRSNKLEGSEKNAAAGEVAAVEEKESKSLESKTSDLKKRKGGKKKDAVAVDNQTSAAPTQSPQQVEASGGFVIGYLNLFSDAVHNFTDGMALGSAFLLHGTVGGWSRTLFLLAHELPQEVGDFGILVKSGFSVFEALAFNFLSALVALAGTAVALMFGGSTGHSSLIEGFIAGGFIYMSVGGVMPSMHDQGSSFISTLAQLVPMVLGMGVAIVISLAE